MEKNKPLKYMAYILVVSWITSMIPLVLLALYAHPWADDFSYGITTAEVWKQSQSLFLVIQEAWAQAGRVYHDWQGSFSAVFLMMLQPAIFGEQFYPIAPILMLSIYTIGVGFLSHVLLCQYGGANRYEFYIITCSILILSVQFMYCPVQGFYWYNGSIYYTFFHSLGMILLGFVLIFNRQQKLAGGIIYFLFSAPLAFFVGGGNYSTALLSTLLLAFLFIRAVWKKEYRNAVLTLVVLLFLFIAFLFSIVSPGNAVRQAQVGQPNAIKAVLTSFIFGGYSVFNAFNTPTLLTWFFLSPVLYSIAKESRFSFRGPIFVAFFSFCFYCAQGTPAFYALGFSIPERNINLIYFSFQFLILINEFYFLGWVSRKIESKKMVKCEIEKFISWWKLRNVKLTAAFCVVFLCTSIGLSVISKGEEGQPSFENSPASGSAILSLLSGEAAQFHQTAIQREAILNIPSEELAVLPAFTAKPELLYYMDITSDPTDWRNQAMSQYYGKESVTLQE